MTTKAVQDLMERLSQIQDQAQAQPIQPAFDESIIESLEEVVTALRNVTSTFQSLDTKEFDFLVPKLQDLAAVVKQAIQVMRTATSMQKTLGSVRARVAVNPAPSFDEVQNSLAIKKILELLNAKEFAEAVANLNRLLNFLDDLGQNIVKEWTGEWPVERKIKKIQEAVATLDQLARNQGSYLSRELMTLAQRAGNNLVSDPGMALDELKRVIHKLDEIANARGMNIADLLGQAKLRFLETKPCPNCKELNPGDHKFCGNCGALFKEDKVPMWIEGLDERPKDQSPQGETLLGNTFEMKLFLGNQFLKSVWVENVRGWLDSLYAKTMVSGSREQRLGMVDLIIEDLTNRIRPYVPNLGWEGEKWFHEAARKLMEEPSSLPSIILGVKTATTEGKDAFRDWKKPEATTAPPVPKPPVTTPPTPTVPSAPQAPPAPIRFASSSPPVDDKFKICPNCHAKNLRTRTNCINCGKSLT